MIPSEKTAAALKSIQALIVQARHKAYGAGVKDVGGLLDDMELLPEMLSDKEDRSQEFRDTLEGIAEKHPQCHYIADQFFERQVGVG